MQIVFTFGHDWGRPIDFSNLWDSPRGLTGSELSFLCYARELRLLGHDVSLYVPQAGETSFDGIPVRPNSQLPTTAQVAISWLDPDSLRRFSKTTLRVCNQQVNDFFYCQAGFDNYVDLYTSPSLPHMAMMIRQHQLSPDKWTVLPNGCYPDAYEPQAKTPGRVVYASSPDRGLHHLLEVWPRIRQQVPSATLRIFYDLHGYLDKMLATPAANRRHPVVAEWYRRADYIQRTLPLLEGVEAIGSVSRNQIRSELLAAEILAYPCDPVTWTEGFSVTTLEACAAGAVPVITSADALGQIYGHTAPMVFMPVRWQLKEYANLVVNMLVAASTRSRYQRQCQALAAEYSWPKLAENFAAELELRMAT